MTEDDHDQQMRQLANLLIDAYLIRDQQFVPEFDPGIQGIMYLCQPEGEKSHPGLRTNVFYERADYEPLVPSSEQKPTRARRKK